ncbi:caspase family protein, partial [bacterium]|nr:caspase family protein [bacterium]
MGIDDYGAELDDAPLCDEDAENLFDTFVRSGIMDKENGIVLTNRDAELMDVENAMHDMAQRVGPDDVFIFFFSGHGDRIAATSRNVAGEIDEYDETLVLRNTDLIDDHLAEMLGEIDAALKVGVLDACHAGGVAEDISRFPKTVGFASSEEDVLSDFAPELDAGGYLSVFFTEAVGGDADLDGDGIIMIGELARFLSNRFYEDG